jgi:hypothetical protein
VGRQRYGITVIPQCVLTSVSGRVDDCEQTPSEESDFKRLRRFFHTRTTSTNARICQNNTARSGWAGGRLYSVIFEVREDKEGEYYHLVTLWKATQEEQELYEEHSL